MRATLLILAALCPTLFAQDETGVPVIVDGKEVLRVYGSVGQFTAKERAPEIGHRITAMAEKPFDGKIITRRIPADKAIAVMAGSIPLMAVTEEDAQFAGLTQEELAKQDAEAIRIAIETYRARHTWQSFLAALGKTAIAWTIFFLSVAMCFKLVRWLSGRVQRWFQTLAANRGSTGFHLSLWERARIFVMTIVKVLAGLLILSEFSFVISFTFGLFPQTAGISTTLLEYLGQTFGGGGMAVLHYLPNGAVVFVTALFTHWLLRALKFLSRAIELGDLSVRGIHPEMAKPTYQLVRILIVIFALVIAFPYLPGGNSEAFKGVSIFLGVLISLGSSSAVSNVLAGLVLTYMRPFRIGDRVKIADTTGDVLEKTLLVTRVRTIKNVEVVIPNSAILGNQILNYSALARTRGLILHTTVTIGYDAPWRTVHELLITAAFRTDGILSDPAPFVLETSLNDWHISYELNAYTDRANEIQNIYSHLHEAIQDSFNQAGVEIMSPTFYALRDGNTVTIPADHRPLDYEAPAFRVRDVSSPIDKPRPHHAAAEIH